MLLTQRVLRRMGWPLQSSAEMPTGGEVPGGVWCWLLTLSVGISAELRASLRRAEVCAGAEKGGSTCRVFFWRTRVWRAGDKRDTVTADGCEGNLEMLLATDPGLGTVSTCPHCRRTIRRLGLLGWPGWWSRRWRARLHGIARGILPLCPCQPEQAFSALAPAPRGSRTRGYCLPYHTAFFTHFFPLINYTCECFSHVAKMVKMLPWGGIRFQTFCLTRCV